MAKKTRRGSGGTNKFLLGIGIVFLLIALFFLSFWITTFSLRIGNKSSGTETENAVVATATPEVNYKKLSKKELIKLLEEKDEEINELKEALGIGDAVTQEPIPSETPVTTPTPESSATPSPAATSTPKPTATPAPTSKPKATPAPTPKPTATPAPTPKPTPTPAPTPAPTPKPSKAPIVPVAPAADSE